MSNTEVNEDLKPYKLEDITMRILSSYYKILHNNKHLPQNKISLLFCGIKKTSISFRDYLLRIVNILNIDIETLTVAIILVERFCWINKIYLNMENIHRIFFTSIIIAIKTNHDIHYKNDIFSLIGGMSLREINKLEIIFLENLDYCLYVNEQIFNYYYNRLLL